MGSTGKTSSSPFDGALHLHDEDSSTQLTKIRQLQRDMGQTGDEAGRADLPTGSRQKLYVRTSKAFDINYYLNTGIVGAPGSDWTTRMGYTKDMIESDIRKIDSGMKPMSESMIAYRYVTQESLANILGVSRSDVSSYIASMKSDPEGTGKLLGGVLKTTDYVQKAYSSLSYDKRHSTFDQYPIRFRTVVAQGTPAIVTNNTAEHEILGGRNSRYDFTGDVRIVNERSAATGRNQDYLEIDVVLRR